MDEVHKTIYDNLKELISLAFSSSSEDELFKRSLPKDVSVMDCLEILNDIRRQFSEDEKEMFKSVDIRFSMPIQKDRFSHITVYAKRMFRFIPKNDTKVRGKRILHGNKI